MALGGLFQLIIVLLVLGVLCWLAFWILGQFPVPEPIGRIIRIIIVVVAVLVLISVLLGIGGYGGPGVLRLP